MSCAVFDVLLFVSRLTLFSPYNFKLIQFSFSETRLPKTYLI
uniref:Uncharacterized protein n=1 Tax=uncultured alpha proteobacterium HF0070_14E07 TaxID=710804 RepID=E0XS62_9PROT|nr:hypothetical protein [uncultured alpha proteobacterium HF0070_14E07]